MAASKGRFAALQAILTGAMGQHPMRVGAFLGAIDDATAARLLAAAESGDTRPLLKAMAEQTWGTAPARQAPPAAEPPASRDPVSFRDRIANEPKVREGLEDAGVSTEGMTQPQMLKEYVRTVRGSAAPRGRPRSAEESIRELVAPSVPASPTRQQPFVSQPPLGRYADDASPRPDYMFSDEVHPSVSARKPPEWSDEARAASAIAAGTGAAIGLDALATGLAGGGNPADLRDDPVSGSDVTWDMYDRPDPFEPVPPDQIKAGNRDFHQDFFDYQPFGGVKESAIGQRLPAPQRSRTQTPAAATTETDMPVRMTPELNHRIRMRRIGDLRPREMEDEVQRAFDAVASINNAPAGVRWSQDDWDYYKAVIDAHNSRVRLGVGGDWKLVKNPFADSDAREPALAQADLTETGNPAELAANPVVESPKPAEPSVAARAQAKQPAPRPAAASPAIDFSGTPDDKMEYIMGLLERNPEFIPNVEQRRAFVAEYFRRQQKPQATSSEKAEDPNLAGADAPIAPDEEVTAASATAALGKSPDQQRKESAVDGASQNSYGVNERAAMERAMAEESPQLSERASVPGGQWTSEPFQPPRLRGDGVPAWAQGAFGAKEAMVDGVPVTAYDRGTGEYTYSMGDVRRAQKDRARQFTQAGGEYGVAPVQDDSGQRVSARKFSSPEEARAYRTRQVNPETGQLMPSQEDLDMMRNGFRPVFNDRGEIIYRRAAVGDGPGPEGMAPSAQRYSRFLAGTPADTGGTSRTPPNWEKATVADPFGGKADVLVPTQASRDRTAARNQEMSRVRLLHAAGYNVDPGAELTDQQLRKDAELKRQDDLAARQQAVIRNAQMRQNPLEYMGRGDINEWQRTVAAEQFLRQPQTVTPLTVQAHQLDMAAKMAGEAITGALAGQGMAAGAADARSRKNADDASIWFESFMADRIPGAIDGPYTQDQHDRAVKFMMARFKVDRPTAEAIAQSREMPRAAPPPEQRGMPTAAPPGMPSSQNPPPGVPPMPRSRPM